MREVLLTGTWSGPGHPRGLPGHKRRGRGTAAPPFPRLVDEALGARALYLDALRGLFYSSSLHGDLKHTVLEAGVDLALVRALRQRHAPAEGTVTALPEVVVTTLLFFVDLVLTGDGQHPVLQRDIHILLLEPRKLGPDYQVVVLCEHVHGWCPRRELPSSLAPPSAAQAPKRLVEEAIDLTLHVVKPTERTHHDPYTSFSLCGPSNRDQTPFCATIIYPLIQFQTLLSRNLQIFLDIHSKYRVLIQFMVCFHWQIETRCEHARHRRASAKCP